MYFGEYKEINILHSDRKQFKLRLGSMDTGLQVKENLFSTEMDFWRRAARKNPRLSEMRKEVIREKMGVTQTISERLENNMLKWCGYVAHMEDNRGPKSE